MSNPQKPEEKKKPTGRVHFVSQVIKGDTYLVMNSSDLTVEDQFQMYYQAGSGGSSDNIAIPPPFLPQILKKLSKHNNILNQCVHAMEVNIDGTGVEVVGLNDGDEPDQGEKKMLENFFSAPAPGETWVAIRRRLRRDLEDVGYAYLEPLRTVDGKLVGLRNVANDEIRMVRLDAPVQVDKVVQRGDETITMHMWVRERRFMQKVGTSTQPIYYKEYGATRDLDRNTGQWAQKGEILPPDRRASELLMFGVDPDVMTPYYVPRWINQLPSVIGSRKAEEENLQFLDAGGMPPAIIFVQGGTLASAASEQLKTYLSGKNKHRARAVVVEAMSSSGSMDSAGTVQIKVERFGAEKANDAMFQAYDKATEEHVRIGFRLPQLFVGRNENFNFATAQIAYMVAEEQVFSPERIEFDDKINATVVKELGATKTKMRSKPITLKEAQIQLAALTAIKDMVDGEAFVNEINKLAGSHLAYKEPPAPPPTAPTPLPGQVFDHNSKPIKIPNLAGIAAPPGLPKLRQVKTANEILDMADIFMQATGLVAKSETFTADRASGMLSDLAALSEEELAALNVQIAKNVEKLKSSSVCDHKH